MKTLWQGSFHFLLQNKGIGLVRSKTSWKWAENELCLWSAFISWRKRSFSEMSIFSLFSSWKRPFHKFGHSVVILCHIWIMVYWNLLKDTAETETEVAEKFSWDQANRGEKLGLVWRNRKKVSQIVNDYLCLPFFLLIILRLKVKKKYF